MRRSRVIIAIVLAIVPHMVSGQQVNRHRMKERVPLTIALVRELPHAGAPYEIHRRTSGAARDVLLLPRTATAEELSDALRSALTARLVTGDTASEAAVLLVRPRGRNAAIRAAFPWADRVLKDLHGAHQRMVPGVGMVQAVVIWLPAQRGRGRPR